VSIPASAPPAAPPPAAETAPRPRGWCRNCDAALFGPFCSNCGQRDSEYSVSLPVLAREFADEYLSFDSRLFRSILFLLVRPGFLTRQYLVGRRERYVRPLRLYIVASLLFFLVIPLMVRVNIEEGRNLRQLFQAEVLDDPAAAGLGGDTLAAAPPQMTPIPDLGTLQVGRMRYSITEHLERLSGMTPQQLFETAFAGFEKYLPRMMFVLLPVFALILKLLYLRRRWFYAEHFIFALHFHAFAFAVFFLLITLPANVWTAGLVLWSIVYLAVAMRKVYKQSIPKTAIKFLLLTGVYAGLVLLGVAASALLGILLV
jgi:hypothetical protein